MNSSSMRPRMRDSDINARARPRSANPDSVARCVGPDALGSRTDMQKPHTNFSGIAHTPMVYARSRISWCCLEIRLAGLFSNWRVFGRISKQPARLQQAIWPSPSIPLPHVWEREAGAERRQGEGDRQATPYHLPLTTYLQHRYKFNVCAYQYRPGTCAPQLEDSHKPSPYGEVSLPGASQHVRMGTRSYASI